jgi:predicted GNAT family acetyltransferase
MTYGERRPDPPPSGEPAPDSREPGVPWVRDHRPGSRYEIILDGELAGVSVYERRPGRVIFTHTEIRPELKGRGLADKLARWALDDVQARAEEKVIARCPFMAAFIARHPEYRVLLAGNQAAVFPTDVTRD